MPSWTAAHRAAPRRPAAEGGTQHCRGRALSCGPPRGAPASCHMGKPVPRPHPPALPVPRRPQVSSESGPQSRAGDPSRGPTTLTWSQQTAGPAWDPRWPRMKRTRGSILRKHGHAEASSHGCRHTRCARHTRYALASSRNTPEAARRHTGRRASPGACLLSISVAPGGTGAQVQCSGGVGRAAGLPPGRGRGRGPRRARKRALKQRGPGAARLANARGRWVSVFKGEGPHPFAFRISLSALFK